MTSLPIEIHQFKTKAELMEWLEKNLDEGAYTVRKYTHLYFRATSNTTSIGHIQFPCEISTATSTPLVL